MAYHLVPSLYVWHNDNFQVFVIRFRFKSPEAQSCIEGDLFLQNTFMPHITDDLRLNDPFLDRRCKLLPCQIEMIPYWYNVKGESIRAIGRRFKVDRRTIDFILFPDKLEANLKARELRGGTKAYYDKHIHRNSMKDHRNYKKKLLK